MFHLKKEPALSPFCGIRTGITIYTNHTMLRAYANKDGTFFTVVWTRPSFLLSAIPISDSTVFPACPVPVSIQRHYREE